MPRARENVAEGLVLRPAQHDRHTGGTQDRQRLRGDRLGDVVHRDRRRDRARDALQRLCLLARAAIGLVQGCSFECLRCEPGERLDEPALVRGQGPGLLAGEAERADDPVSNDQRDRDERAVTADLPDRLGHRRRPRAARGGREAR